MTTTVQPPERVTESSDSRIEKRKGGWLRRMVRRLPKIRYAKHCWTRCALKICMNQHGINQCDAMIFGLCLYWWLPRWKTMEQIHITAGLWKSQVFSHGEIYDVVILLRLPPNEKAQAQPPTATPGRK